MICVVLSIFMPVLLGAYWVFFNHPINGVTVLIPRNNGILTICIITLSAMPVLLMSVALLSLRRSLLAMADGNYFSPTAVSPLRRFAWLTFAAAIAGIVVPSLIDALVSLANGGGSVRVAIGSQQLLFALFAGLMGLFARMLERASAIAEENAQFV